ncbi:beta-1 adrenergic receptor-like [Apostichopus japonicus]|uniref:beta-1 adrenergic receptor-like n=1 Tax=Stichopus japonicus TaxID=307972 RepID=UPI003AB3A234
MASPLVGLITDGVDDNPRDHESWSEPLLVLRLILMHAIGLLAIGMNVLNIAVLYKVQCFHDATKLFLRVLAVVDLSSGFLTLISENIQYWGNLKHGVSYFCEITYLGAIFLIISSLFLLSCLSLDRIIAVTKPLRYPTLMDKKRAALVATAALSLACLLAIGLLSRKSPLDNVYYDAKYRFCSISGFDSDIQFALALGGSISLIVIICTTAINIKLLFVALKQSKRNRTIMIKPPSDTSHIVNNVGDRDKLPAVMNIQISRWQEMKALRTVLTMTVAIYLAYLPLTMHATRFAIGLTPHGMFYEFFAYVMIYCNAWFNPVIYLFSNKGYRKAAVKVLKQNWMVKYAMNL